MTPRCSTCEVCVETPFYDERTETLKYDFDCGDANGRMIAIGNDRDTLPKTSRRWCPRRKASQQHRVVVAREDKNNG